jgi:RNA polymerase sigma-70 factor (ECF subfamily)
MTNPTSTPASRPGGDGLRDRRPTASESAVAALEAEQFAVRLQASARVLWTVAAGVLGNRSHVEDVLQEAALIGLQKLDQFRPDSNFTAWMARIVRYVALNQVRTRSRRRTVDSDPVRLDREPGLARDVAGPARPVVDLAGELGPDDGAFDDELSGALAELKPIARACLLLRTLLDLEYQEIARSLDIPLGTAVSHVHRARRFLRQRLADGPTPSSNPAAPAPRVAAGKKGLP